MDDSCVEADDGVVDDDEEEDDEEEDVAELRLLLIKFSVVC